MNSDNQYQFLDIDWFLRDHEGDILHVASAGGKLPDSIVESRQDHDSIILFFRNLPAISKVDINPNLEKYITFKSDLERERYLQDFIRMAMKGIYSFDKSDLTNLRNDQYHLVASPQTKINLKDLPSEIIATVGKTMLPDLISKRETFNSSEVQ